MADKPGPNRDLKRFLLFTMFFLLVVHLLYVSTDANAGTKRPVQTFLNQATEEITKNAPVTISCARTKAEWNAEIQRELGFPNGSFVYGYTYILEGVIRLSPWVCNSLRYGPGRPEFGMSLNVVAHEATHATGVWDEAFAACNALRWTPWLANRYYGIPYHTKQMRELVKDSRNLDSTLPEQYHATSCDVR